MRRGILIAAALLALAPAAAHASAGALIRDCLKNGKVTGSYSRQDYAQALANLPTDVAEYSDCAAVIRSAQLANAAGRGARGRGTGGQTVAGRPANTLQDPLAGAAAADRSAVAQARRTGGSAQDVGGRLISPGQIHVSTSSLIHALPTPLLLVLGALLSIVLSVSGRRIWDLVRARRSR